MGWYRAASIAFCVHLAVLLLFTFTFRGTPDTYKVDLVFWGPILRLQEVSAAPGHVSPGPEDVKHVNVPAGPRTGLLLWSRGIAIDKPDLFKNGLSALNDRLFRFVGERVELDEPQDPSLHPENDTPQLPPVKMRLERP